MCWDFWLTNVLIDVARLLVRVSCGYGRGFGERGQLLQP